MDYLLPNFSSKSLANKGELMSIKPILSFPMSFKQILKLGKMFNQILLIPETNYLLALFPRATSKQFNPFLIYNNTPLDQHFHLAVFLSHRKLILNWIVKIAQDSCPKFFYVHEAARQVRSKDISHFKVSWMSNLYF